MANFFWEGEGEASNFIAVMLERMPSGGPAAVRLSIESATTTP
jgi:hypothetical protein